MNPILILTAEFRNNGKLDLAVLNQVSGSVTILLGIGDGTFATAVDYDLPSGTVPTQGMAIADLNGDGYPDVAVAGNTASPSSNGVVTVFLTNSNGTLGAGTNRSEEH